MDPSEVKFYFAYTSPFSYLAYAPARALEESHHVRVQFIPYGVNIRRVYGPLDNPDADRRKVRYLYLDARRIARERGLVIYPPTKIFSCRLAFYGGLFAQHHARFHEYSERVFERFWRHELDVEQREAIEGVLSEVGCSSTEFAAYVDDHARAELDDCFKRADHDQVFGVPTFVVDRELFWGEDRINWVIAKLDRLHLRR